MSIIVAGFLLGLSLIVAIGPQNALIIRQGIKRHAVIPVLLVCMTSDIFLILGGTAGVGALIEKAPIALVILKYLGAAYLAWFGFSCFRDAFSRRGSSMVVDHSDEIESSTSIDSDLPTTGGGSVAVQTRTQTRTWVKPVLAALAFTWLNPAAYIDALIMLGGMANQHGETGRWYFAFGALLASATWFPLLGFGSSYFSDVLARPKAWRIINFTIGCIMVVMCARVLMH
ncbi:LysE/ArgO family amino acid transporter [Corynebacterium felinum]|uniref:L-lysine exporter family protein LysE/ArgO n=1 Tax=Corynebacterium felinum TaxID=131318 RepID=A0ABU2B9V1_9CORY|nr:LysE/ArgO family amino acid transporter [Corynebacterium felinum]MDF5821811.1 LysE/ArgO family amino acid transporter [Corynebacterium felinum]MDR7355380.1 L-lysine exporter family protein LysE/ArgO [Corynebacterium felinum]WJY94732.1 Arginine exporter protein ArgO [Corynebacterium felinum]